MENLSPIVENILGKARTEADAIIRKAEEAAAKANAGALASAEAHEAKIAADAAKAGEEELRRARIASSLEARNRVLEAKNKLIAEVLAELPAKLHTLNSRDYSNLMRGFVLSVAPMGLVHVIPAEIDSDAFNSAFVMGLNQALQSRGQDTTLILTGEKLQSSGGLILKSDTITVDCTLESICGYYKDALEPVISSALFSE